MQISGFVAWLKTAVGFLGLSSVTGKKPTQPKPLSNASVLDSSPLRKVADPLRMKRRILEDMCDCQWVEGVLVKTMRRWGLSTECVVMWGRTGREIAGKRYSEKENKRKENQNGEDVNVICIGSLRKNVYGGCVRVMGRLQIDGEGIEKRGERIG